MTKVTSLITCIGATLLAASPVLAVALPANTTLPATATVVDPALGSLAATNTQSFTAAMFKGSITTQVRQESIVANPLGGLTFTYSLSNDSTSLTTLKRLITASFDSFITDASFFGAGQAPLTFERDGGPVVAANFTGLAQIDPNETSTLLVVRTNAPGFVTSGVLGIIDGGAVELAGFAPVPEPATLGVIGLTGLGLLARRRRSN